MSRNIRTLQNISRNDDHDSGEESDGGERQGFFVGGSEHSGQQVLGPQRPGRGNIAERVFDAARQHGAEALNSSDLSPRVGDGLNASIIGDSSTARHSRSGGGGVRLGEALAQNRDDGSSSESDTREHEEEVVVELFMWSNGFSIDDGPLRSFEEPESRQFLESIMKGEVPAELLAAHPRRRIDLRMQKRSGPYEPPKLKPFQGAGARLGAIVPEVVSSAPAPSSSTTTNTVDNVAKAQAEVNLDSSSPVTQIQIRLPSGQRVSGRFNQAHTVGSIRTFLVTAYPDMAATPFQLMTTFPNKVIDDESIDLKDAGLVNAVVVVKLCS